LREELDQVLGQRTEVTHEDLGKLKYCTSVFKESLRLWTPAPELSRRIAESMEIDGYFIPKKTVVMVGIYI
jgi:cytochrome P450